VTVKRGPMRWGLAPFWAKDQAIRNKMINARSETLADRPPFKDLLSSRRCLVPADGFYETTQPMPNSPLASAGNAHSITENGATDDTACCFQSRLSRSCSDHSSAACISS